MPADPVITNIPGSVPADQAAFFMSVKRSIEFLMGQTRNTDQARAVRVYELDRFFGEFVKEAAGRDLSQSQEVPDPPTNLVVDPTAPFVHKLTWTNPLDPIVSHIEIWAAVNTQNRDLATLVGIATVTEATRGQEGVFLHGGIIVTYDYTYWIRSVSYGGVNSVWCPPDIQGGYVVQGADSVQEAIDDILALLHGEITENQLYLALNERLDAHDSLIPVVEAIAGRYTVKIDSNGYVSGFGFAVTENDGVPESEFIFLTDKFKIVTPGATPQIPFAVGTVDGVSIVGIRGNLVLDGTMLGTAIQAGTVTADRMNMQQAFVGMTIQSTNFQSGVQGWQITKDGNVQFNGGILTISYGDVTGTKPPVDADKTSANTAYDTARVGGTLAATVRNNAALGATFTSDHAGAMAYLNNLSGFEIGNAIAYGQTLISGGYINTALLQVNTAQITNAAITNAKIGNLAVDTLKINNNSVTVTVSATSVGSMAEFWALLDHPADVLVIGTITINVSTWARIRLGSTILQQEIPQGGTLATMIRKVSLAAGEYHFICDGGAGLTSYASVTVLVAYK